MVFVSHAELEARAGAPAFLEGTYVRDIHELDQHLEELEAKLDDDD